ncbi:MAG TPA: DUF1254 domain-containing protein [Burkholderiaceae bacterium]
MLGATPVPGFYLLAGPHWQGKAPAGITHVFRASTNTGFIAPRIFMDDTAEDRRAIQPLLQQILLYPLDEYDGTMKRIDWNTIEKLPNPAKGEQEVIWVPPQNFVDTLPAMLADAPPLPGEEARYAQVLAVLEAASKDPQLKAAMTEGAVEADEQTGQAAAAVSQLRRATAAPLEHDLQRSRLWHRLFHPHGGPTSSSTRPSRPSISIKTSTPPAHGSTASIATR